MINNTTGKMEVDAQETKVIFRFDPETNEVIAIFPEVPGSSRYDCPYYALVGQHSTCDPVHSISITQPATEEDYGRIKAELENSFGYRLKVCKRYTRKMFENRLEEFRSYYARQN